MSIIEYLDEVYPDPPLLPKDPEARAHARAIAFHISSNIQPLQGSLCREKLGIQWCHDVICRGFDALEQLLKLYSGRFCVGDLITIPDLMVPSIVRRAREKYNVDMEQYPIIRRIEEELAGFPEFWNNS
uniref:GST C-terminal domain-containing protein n=1 Tax=Caenorhabditis tropicalis TaxID=1561998 RepID=A0A1I7USM2_9PELO